MRFPRILTEGERQMRRHSALIADGRRHHTRILYGWYIAAFWLCMVVFAGTAIAWVTVDHDTIMKVFLLAAAPPAMFFGWRLAVTSGTDYRMMARATGQTTDLPVRTGLAALALLGVAYLASPWSIW